MACADANTTLYNHSEFRFGIAAYSSSHLRVLGLNISSTGGDDTTFCTSGSPNTSGNQGR